MKNEELFYQDQEISIGSYQFNRGISLEIHSAKDTTYDWAKIKFTKEFQENIVLQKEDVAIIKMGYNGVLEEIFAGFLSKPYNAASGMDEILIKDTMLLLNRTEITNTYIETTPQEMIEYGLKKAGIAKYQLSDILYPIKSKVPICKMGFLEVLKKINQLWGIHNKGYFIGSTFYWGLEQKQNRVYEFEYGNNIISLTREYSLWMLTTVSFPYIRHGMKISVNHPKVTGVFEIIKMTFKTNEAGFVRTELYFEDTV